MQKTLNINITDTDYKKFGIKNEQMTLADFVSIIKNELERQNPHRRIKRKTNLGERKIYKNKVLLGIQESIKEIKAGKQLQTLDDFLYENSYQA